MSTIKHPAKYTNALLPVMAEMAKDSKNILDPFGGTGKIFSISQWLPNAKISAIELETEWASLDKRTIIGNALYLPYADNSFSTIITSPTYGNRMADKKPSKSKYTRMSYACMLGRNLSKDNSGSLQWGDGYREFHIKAWTEAKRVLQNNGIFVLNIKNHIRNKKEQFVTEWHIGALEDLGFEKMQWEKILVPSMKRGQNGEARIPYESVIKFVLRK